MIAFSADAGNIVTSLRWTTWTKTDAFGKGQSDIQTCVPSCASGGLMPVSAYILLSHPVNGRFTHLTESQGGQITHAVDSGRAPTAAQITTGNVSPWPFAAIGYAQALRQHLRALGGA